MAAFLIAVCIGAIVLFLFNSRRALPTSAEMNDDGGEPGEQPATNDAVQSTEEMLSAQRDYWNVEIEFEAEAKKSVIKLSKFNLRKLKTPRHTVLRKVVNNDPQFKQAMGVEKLVTREEIRKCFSKYKQKKQKQGNVQKCAPINERPSSWYLLAAVVHWMACSLLTRAHSMFFTGYDIIGNMCISIFMAIGLSLKGTVAVINERGKVKIRNFLECVMWGRKLKMEAKADEDENEPDAEPEEVTTHGDEDGPGAIAAMGKGTAVA